MDSSYYKVFTIAGGNVTPGALIETLHLKGAGVDIPAIMVGEEGRGRERGVVPVGNPPMVPCPDRGSALCTERERCGKCGVELSAVEAGHLAGNRYARNHPDAGVVQGRLTFAEIGQTKAGKPKVFAKSEATTTEMVIVVFNTKIGFRGGNSHTGDRSGWKCSKYGCDASGEGAFNAPSICPKCGAEGGYYDGPKLLFAEFPGKIIARGRIAEGAAGRAGGGEQFVALIPKDVVFRTAYSGRLYGGPSSHYYQWDGERIIAATWEERSAADLF